MGLSFPERHTGNGLAQKNRPKAVFYHKGYGTKPFDASGGCTTVGRRLPLSDPSYPSPERDTCPSGVDTRHAGQPEHGSQKECAAANLADQHGIFLPERRKKRNGKGGTGEQNRQDERTRETQFRGKIVAGSREAPVSVRRPFLEHLPRCCCPTVKPDVKISRGQLQMESGSRFFQKLLHTVHAVQIQLEVGSKRVGTVAVKGGMPDALGRASFNVCRKNAIRFAQGEGNVGGFFHFMLLSWLRGIPKRVILPLLRQVLPAIFRAEPARFLSCHAVL